MNFLSLHWVARALGLSPSGPDQPISQLSSDTRELKPGSLFVALKGPSFDGHAFAQDGAIEAGELGGGAFAWADGHEERRRLWAARDMRMLQPAER